MAGVGFRFHNGRKVLYLDFSTPDLATVNTLVKDCRSVIDSQPENSLLVVTNVTDCPADPAFGDSMQELARQNKPYVKASAIVGITGLKKVYYMTAIAFTGRKIHLADSVDEAFDWVTKQD